MNNLPQELKEMLDYYKSKPESSFVDKNIYSLYKDYFGNKIAGILLLRDILGENEVFKKDSLYFAYKNAGIKGIKDEVKRRIDLFLSRQKNKKLAEFSKTAWHTQSNADFLEDEIFE